jgi:pilus assembly protein Flp/PilA
MKNLLLRFGADDSGVTAIEYGLIAGLIAVVIIGAVTTLGTKVSSKLGAIATTLGG